VTSCRLAGGRRVSAFVGLGGPGIGAMPSITALYSTMAAVLSGIVLSAIIARLREFVCVRGEALGFIPDGLR